MTGRKELVVIRAIFLTCVVKGFFFTKTPTRSTKEIIDGVSGFKIHPRHIRKVVDEFLIPKGALELQERGKYKINMEKFWQILEQEEIFNMDMQIINSRYELIKK